MNRELMEALIGQRKRLEIELDELKKDLAGAKEEDREKVSKNINEIESKIRQLNASISDLKSSEGKGSGVIPPYV